MANRDKRSYSDRRRYLIAAVSARRRKVRDLAIRYKGGKCEYCGYSKCIEALEFHHVNSSKKDFGISRKGYTRSWERVKEELDKCILLCANCHRELHVQVSSSCGKLQGANRPSRGRYVRSQREKASKFRETLRIKGNPEPSPKREGAETRHSLPKSEEDKVKV